MICLSKLSNWKLHLSRLGAGFVCPFGGLVAQATRLAQGGSGIRSDREFAEIQRFTAISRKSRLYNFNTARTRIKFILFFSLNYEILNAI